MNPFKITATELKHKDEHCWDECNKIQGRCNWCGSKGYCCRKNWKAGNGCDGSFGGTNHHVCVMKPGITYAHKLIPDPAVTGPYYNYRVTTNEWTPY